MNPIIAIRPFSMSDYPEALALWGATEGLGLNESDNPKAIDAFLLRNPGCSPVAMDASGILVATALCSHDPRGTMAERDF